MRKWYRKAVMKKPPYSLAGWKKTQLPTIRRSRALGSRPRNWTLRRKRLSAGRALIALSNVTRDRPTRMKAKADAKYFFRKLR